MISKPPVAGIGATCHETAACQPAGRYWPLQWYQLAIVIGAALVLAAVCLRRIRRA